jgi:hypothetical protein
LGICLSDVREGLADKVQGTTKVDAEDKVDIIEAEW